MESIISIIPMIAAIIVPTGKALARANRRTAYTIINVAANTPVQTPAVDQSRAMAIEKKP